MQSCFCQTTHTLTQPFSFVGVLLFFFYYVFFANTCNYFSTTTFAIRVHETCTIRNQTAKYNKCNYSFMSTIMTFIHWLVVFTFFASSSSVSTSSSLSPPSSSHFPQYHNEAFLNKCIISLQILPMTVSCLLVLVKIIH